MSGGRREAGKKTIHTDSPNQLLLSHFLDYAINANLPKYATEAQHVYRGANIERPFLSSGTGHGFNFPPSGWVQRGKPTTIKRLQFRFLEHEPSDLALDSRWLSAYNV